MKKTTKKIKRFTLIEILMVVIILGILMAILLPMLANSKEHAQAVVCMNNMKNVALGYKNYLNDYDNEFPLIKYWLDDFHPIFMYVKSDPDVFVCSKTGNTGDNVWDSEGLLRDGDFLRGGTITDVEKNMNWNNGHGNNPYHFDISNPSQITEAVMASKRNDRVLYERYWGSHFDGMFFNVVYIDDLHAEREYDGQSAYWMLDDRDWIQTDLNPFPEDSRTFDTTSIDGGGGGGGGPPVLGDCTFCGGDGVRDNGSACNKCGGDGWL